MASEILSKGQSDSLDACAMVFILDGFSSGNILLFISISVISHVNHAEKLASSSLLKYYTPFSSLCSDNYICLNPDIAKHPTLKAKSLIFSLFRILHNIQQHYQTTKCLALMQLSPQMTPEVRISEMPIIPVCESFIQLSRPMPWCCGLCNAPVVV